MAHLHPPVIRVYLVRSPVIGGGRGGGKGGGKGGGGERKRCHDAKKQMEIRRAILKRLNKFGRRVL